MLAFLTHCARNYGELASFRLGPRRLYLASHPDLIEQILVTQQQAFPRRPHLLTMNRILFGRSLTVSEGDFWQRQRRLCQPAFHKSHVDTYDGLMVDCAERLVASWPDGEPRDLHAELIELTLRIAAKTVFDIDVTTEGQIITESLHTIMHYIDARLSSLLQLPDWVPVPSNIRLRRMMRRMDALVSALIHQRRASGEQRGDILSLLLSAEDEHGLPMDDALVCDEAQNLMMAGVETTAVSLCWTWYLLSSHPEVDARLWEEWRTTLGGRPPTVADVPKLEYTRHVIWESMRLYPPSYLGGREAAERVELGGYVIPSRSDVLVSQWVTHRDPRWFDDPETFRPARWENGLSQRLPRGAYFPFGLGPRSCIAAQFASLEMVLLLATIGQRARLTQETPGHEVKPWPSFALRPRGGMWMRLHRRAGQDQPAPEG